MRNLRGLVLNGVIIAALSASLSACVVYPAYPGARVAYVGPTIAVAPPAPIVETYGAPPYAGAVWIGGYWDWVGGRHVWHGGGWQAGRPGYAWEPHRWVAVNGGYRMAPGHWVRR
jgi:hypothetical protein